MPHVVQEQLSVGIEVEIDGGVGDDRWNRREVTPDGCRVDRRKRYGSTSIAATPSFVTASPGAGIMRPIEVETRPTRASTASFNSGSASWSQP